MLCPLHQPDFAIAGSAGPIEFRSAVPEPLLSSSVIADTQSVRGEAWEEPAAYRTALDTHAGGMAAHRDEATDDSVAVVASDRRTSDTRFRIMGGALLVLLIGDGALPVINVNYRASTNALLEGAESRLGWGFEVGLNYILPYATVGPEFRIGRFLVAGEFGATILAGPGAVEVVPMLNAHAGYLTSVTGARFELETGAIALVGDRVGLLPYVAAALAFR